MSDVTLVPDNAARAGFVGTTNVGVAPAVAPAALAVAGAERPRSGQRHRRSLQPSAANHPRRFRHHAPGLQPLGKRHALRRLHGRRQLRQHALRQSAELGGGRPARTGGQRSGAARLLADAAEHGALRLFARQLFLHRRDAGGPAGLGCRRSDRRRGGRRRHGFEWRVADHRRRHQRRQQSARGAQSLHLRRPRRHHPRHPSDRSRRLVPAHSGQRQSWRRINTARLRSAA